MNLSLLMPTSYPNSRNLKAQPVQLDGRHQHRERRAAQASCALFWRNTAVYTL
jgi:hypothetical protein